MSDTIYTEVKGTTCYWKGERGTVVQLLRPSASSLPTSALIRLANRPAMLLAQLGGTHGDRNQWHEIRDAIEINRDDFDRLTGLAEVRREMGWDL